MATLALEGETLGEKHKHYNKLVEKAIVSNKLESGDFNSGEGDVDKLVKIDLASNKRDVEYVLEVLKCEDMLYVTRAIKRSTWLVTEPQYTHIINPHYLHTQLFPQMVTKASNKFIKHIRLHLKDEVRAEEFYKNEQNADKAAKWLPNCSADFIEKHISKHDKSLKRRLLKRICEKSNKALEIIITDGDYRGKQWLEATNFMLSIDAGRYLDLVEKQNPYSFPKFGIKTTQVLMEKFPNRIIDKFDVYCQTIDLATFVKYIKTEDVKKVLYMLANRENRHYTGYLYHFNNLKLLIQALPEKERFTFVNQVFINKIHTEKDDDVKSEKYEMRQLCIHIIPRIPVYKFYEFASFATAFVELKKLIEDEPSPDVKSSMLAVLITCAGRNLPNIRTVLQYYRDKHYNDKLQLKHNFVNRLLSQTDFHKYDEDTWKILDDIYKSMEIYTDSKTDKQLCIESIIVYQVLHNSTVPDIVEKQFKLNTLKRYQTRLNQAEKNKIFNYLFNQELLKLQNQKATNEKEFETANSLLEMVLNLLLDWKKELNDYPWVVDKIKEFVKIKKDNSWETSLSPLYNKKKSWKKYLFEESLELSPSEEVCVNIIKHGPEQLARHNSQVEKLCRDDKISLRRPLCKLRIYWSESLANQWTGSYLERLDQLGGHKALVRGLCALLSRKQLLELISKYAPQTAEVDWSKTSELELSLQRHIAKNMHFARPQPTPDAILLYAKGDYLQYALPSLLAIFYNMTASRTRECIGKLLDSPVSIQKHGIRIAFNKLTPDELKHVFPDIWKVTKNASIRAVIFKFTYDLICKETDPMRLKNIWESFATFMDSLSYEEDKRIYDFLTEDKVQKMPMEVRADYLVKSYEFLKRLIPNTTGTEAGNYKYRLLKLAEYSREIVQFLPQKFVADLLLEYIDEKFVKEELNDQIVSLMSAYLLCVKDEGIQTEKYNNIVVPLMQSCFASWDKMKDKDYFIRRNFQKFLNALCDDLKYIVTNNFIVPVAMYSDIQSELFKLPVAENYMMLTKWRLTVELAKLVEKHKQDDSDWDVICGKMASDFGDSCLGFLKEDVKLYFSCIYLLFARSLRSMLDGFFSDETKWDVYKRMTIDQQCIEAYLALIKEFPEYLRKEEVKPKEIRQILLAHPSVEVKMHCYHKFKIEN